MSLSTRKNINSFYNRENEKFWIPFISELKEEILKKKLLSDFINKVGTNKKKEDGHTHAQAWTDFLIENVFPFCDTINKYGLEIMTPEGDREHGDFYFITKNNEDNIKIRCNGKFGSAKKMGQPNQCSINRAIEYLHQENLPYLMFKLRFIGETFKFDLFDLYNQMDSIVYDDGPGQLMMNEKKFYEKKEFKYSKTLYVMRYLYKLNVEGFDKLQRHRLIKLDKNRQILEKHESNQVK